MKTILFAAAWTLCAAPLWAQDHVTLPLCGGVTLDHDPVIIAHQKSYCAEQHLAWGGTVPRFARHPGATDIVRSATFDAGLHGAGLIRAIQSAGDIAIDGTSL